MLVWWGRLTLDRQLLRREKWGSTFLKQKRAMCITADHCVTGASKRTVRSIQEDAHTSVFTRVIMHKREVGGNLNVQGWGLLNYWQATQKEYYVATEVTLWKCLNKHKGNCSQHNIKGEWRMRFQIAHAGLSQFCVKNVYIDTQKKNWKG